MILQSTTTTATAISILELPMEIHPQIADFLDVADAIHYQQTCKHLQEAIHLDLLHHASPAVELNLPVKFMAVGDYSTGDIVQRWVILDSWLFPTQVHTVLFTCHYRDQGWGNRKGVIYITELSESQQEEEDHANADVRRNHRDKVIVQSDTAQHYDLFLCLKFKPKPGVQYAICYKVGGGGGHELYIDHSKLKSVVYTKSAKFANMFYDSFHNSFMTELIRLVLDEAVEEIEEMIVSKTGTAQELATLSSIASSAGQSLEMMVPFSNKSHSRFVTLFHSIGLDLTNMQHIEDARAVLKEYERFLERKKSSSRLIMK